MPATELVVTSAGRIAEKEMLVPTGKQGNILPHLQEWLTAKLKAKASVKDISRTVLVKGIKQGAVYEERPGSKTIRTVVKIT